MTDSEMPNYVLKILFTICLAEHALPYLRCIRLRTAGRCVESVWGLVEL